MSFRLSLLRNSEAEGAGINPAPTKTGVGEGFIPSQPNCHFIDKTPLWGFLQEAHLFKHFFKLLFVKEFSSCHTERV